LGNAARCERAYANALRFDLSSSAHTQTGCSFNIGQLTTKFQLESGKCEISVKEA